MSSHPELQQIRTRLSIIHDALDNFNLLIPKPPIIDSSVAKTDEPGEENQWMQQGIGIPGLKKLKEDIGIDLSVLDKFLNDPKSAHLPPISTNAPYVIAVWNEVLCASQPILSVFKTFFLNPDEEDPGKKQASKRHRTGVKVDVVADNGKRWIRVNTIKNSRLLAEFKEIDSYLNDSEEEDLNDEWDNEEYPSLNQAEFDNSILRMGRSLLASAKANPIEGTTDTPIVVLRLTRLDPNLPEDDGRPPDPRIRQTMDMLQEMGIEIELGERQDASLPIVNTSPDPPSSSLRPTTNIILDLSVLIAIISDLTHAPLPQSIQDANKRFVPPPEYREWKKKRTAMTPKKHKPTNDKPMTPGSDPSSVAVENDINDLPKDLIKHARQLTNQLLQEMGRGMLHEIRDRVAGLTGVDSIKFWTTSEARDRCLRIVWKIGGIQEKRRVRALFQLPADATDTIPQLSLEEAEDLYWQDSRFPHKFVPWLPIQILPGSSSSASNFDLHTSQFALELAKVCSDILSQETTPIIEPDNTPDVNSTSSMTNDTTFKPSYNTFISEEIQRARFTKANPRLTAHTVQTMQWGATLGWTILTANRTSVKAILRELKGAKVASRLSEMRDDGKGDEKGKMRDYAAIWIVDPRSLAEGMSSFPAKS